MNDTILNEALRQWGVSAPPHLVAQRENHVYAVQKGGAKCALRLHRPGYRTQAELRSELDWMQHLAGAGLTVPTPVPTQQGDLLATINGQNVSVLTWLAGTPIGEGTEITQGTPTEVAGRVGREMARLHTVTDAWEAPAGFSRPRWTAPDILGDTPLWGRFWEHPHLSQGDTALLQAARLRAAEDCARMDQDIGLIHADLLTENLLVEGDKIGILDFDDCAIGYRAFELATFLLRYLERPDFDEIRAALVQGYAARRPIPSEELDLALLLRALTYVGWIIPRLDEPGGDIRSTRMIARATRLAQDYLEGRP